MRMELALLSILLTACATTGEEGVRRPQRTLVPTTGAVVPTEGPLEVIGGKGKGLDATPKSMVTRIAATPPVYRQSPPHQRPPPR
jgi:hypothetical protein